MNTYGEKKEIAEKLIIPDQAGIRTQPPESLVRALPTEPSGDCDQTGVII